MELLNTLNGIQKEAGFRDSATKLVRDALGKNVKKAQKRVTEIQQAIATQSAIANDTTQTIGSKLKQYSANRVKELDPLLQAAKHKL